MKNASGWHSNFSLHNLNTLQIGTFYFLTYYTIYDSKTYPTTLKHMCIHKNKSKHSQTLPSIGLPKASTTLPSSSLPVGTSTIAPVLFTMSPSLISLSLPNTTTPTLSGSKFKAMPCKHSLLYKTKSRDKTRNLQCKFSKKTNQKAIEIQIIAPLLKMSSKNISKI